MKNRLQILTVYSNTKMLPTQQDHPNTGNKDFMKKNQASLIGKNSIKSTITSRTNNRNRITSRNGKQSKEARQSRSRSSSSYCEAGCTRGSNGKDTLKKPPNPPKIDGSRSKLFSAIQKFYTNLSSMPLDILISHTNPQNWLQQQHQTCSHLMQKLQKIYSKSADKENKNTGNFKQENQGRIREEHYFYYRSKLEAVEGVLGNIQRNLRTLGQLYQQQLTNYASNSSLSSCSNSKQTSNHKNNQPSSQNSPISTITNPISDKPLPISHKIGKQYKKQQSMYQIKEGVETGGHTFGSVDGMSEDSGHRSRSKSKSKSKSKSRSKKRSRDESEDDIYEKMLTKLNNNLNKLSKNTPKEPLLNPSVNESKWQQNMAQFLSTCRSQQSPEQHRNIPQSSQKSSIKNSQERTKRISTVSQTSQLQSLSEMLAMSLVNCAQTGNLGDVQQMKTMFKKLAITLKKGPLQSNPIDTKQETSRFLRNPPYPQPPQFPSNCLHPSPTLQSLKPLLSQLCSLKHQITQKNTSLQNLLSTQQELQQIIELYKKNQKQHKENMMYSGERIKNLENVVSKYQKEIGRYQACDGEMRETLRSQVGVVKGLQREKEELERRVEEERANGDKLRKEIEAMKKVHHEEMERMKKSQSVAIEKMEIYKQKYYQIVHEGELKKIVLNNTYEGKAGKVKQIWGILHEHRKNLHTLDQTQPKRHRNPKQTPNPNSSSSSQQSQPQNDSSSLSMSLKSSQPIHPIKMQQKYRSEASKFPREV